MALRVKESVMEELPKILYGLGGFPQFPERKRWYVCTIGYNSRTCYEIPTERFCPHCKTVDVPEYLPKFLDKYVIQSKFNDRIPVTISEQTMSQGTYCLGRLTPSERPPESPSAHQTPSATYKDERKQPETPFQ